MDNRPIGIFDSGIGGLTVVKKIRELLPSESLIYIGDTARVPYGTRSPETIAKFSCEVASKLLEMDVKILVVACNTISSTCLPEIISLSSVPVINVIEPTVEEAVAQTRSKVIAVIGTKATISSGIYKNQIQSLDPTIKVISRAAPLFVPLTEEGLFNHPVTKLMITEYLQPIKDSFADVLILGCTHYPLIREEVERFLGNTIQVVDSAVPTAKALKKLIQVEKSESSGGGSTQIYFTSDDPGRSINIAKEFLGGNLLLQKITL